MRRRDFITLIGVAGGVGAAWPLRARAQQTAMPLIAFLNGQSPAQVAPYVAAFRAGLKSAGYVEGENIAIDFRYAEGRRERLPAMAAEVARSGPAVIVTTGGTPVTVAAKAATATVPIVFAMGGDPVALGLVASLNQPGGNATGACYFFNALGPKRLELLLQLAPSAKVIGYLINPSNPSVEAESRELHEAARARGIELRVAKASGEREIDAAFLTFGEQRVNAFMVAADVLFTLRRDQLVALAARHALPASYHTREIVEVGGLMSYGPSQAEAYQQAGIYTGRILKGEKPADLPVVQATKFELVLNFKTARALALEVPDKVLALADDVIE